MFGIHSSFLCCSNLISSGIFSNCLPIRSLYNRMVTWASCIWKQKYQIYFLGWSKWYKLYFTRQNQIYIDKKKQYIYMLFFLIEIRFWDEVQDIKHRTRYIEFYIVMVYTNAKCLTKLCSPCWIFTAINFCVRFFSDWVDPLNIWHNSL